MNEQESQDFEEDRQEARAAHLSIPSLPLFEGRPFGFDVKELLADVQRFSLEGFEPRPEETPE